MRSMGSGTTVGSVWERNLGVRRTITSTRPLTSCQLHVWFRIASWSYMVELEMEGGLLATLQTSSGLWMQISCMKPIGFSIFFGQIPWTRMLKTLEPTPLAFTLHQE